MNQENYYPHFLCCNVCNRRFDNWRGIQIHNGSQTHHINMVKSMITNMNWFNNEWNSTCILDYIDNNIKEQNKHKIEDIIFSLTEQINI